MTERPEPEHWPYVESDLHGWPSADDCERSGDFKSELCKAKLEVRKKRTDQEIARAKADHDASIAIAQEYYAAVLEVAKGAIDRARASADTVQKAAAAIVTLYAGILAVAFSAADNPLPLRATFAAVLLGAAILLSTAFLAYLPSPKAVREEEAQESAHPTAGGAAGERLAALFVLWTRKASLACTD